MNDDRTTVSISVPALVEALAHDRLVPINQRMEALAADNQRLREGAALEAATSERVRAAEERAEARIHEADEKAEAKVKGTRAGRDQWRERAYRAEYKLKKILNGELDPFDLMTPEEIERASESAVPSPD